MSLKISNTIPKKLERLNPTRKQRLLNATTNHRQVKQLQYTQLITYIKLTIEQSAFFLDLQKSLSSWNHEYINQTSHPLLMNDELAGLNSKPYNSVLDKIYRLSILQNPHYPNPPTLDWRSQNKTGWITLTTLFDDLNDLVRTKISCKFIDGPELLAKKIQALASRHDLICFYSSKNHDDGYYAYHAYVKHPMELYINGSTIKIEPLLEIQISTQLKDVMYEILHNFYAEDRSKSSPKDWKWDIGTPKFRSGFLSHTLHLIEAMIVDLRDKK